MRNSHTFDKAWLVVMASGLLAGCAAPADSGHMTVGAASPPPASATPRPAPSSAPTNAAPAPAPATYPAALATAICVRQVTGGSATNPLWISKVGDDGFRTALSASLDKAGLLAQPGACKYQLDVNLLGVSQPSVGISMTAKSNVNYKLYDGANQPVMLETISASYTAQFSEAFIGMTRAKRAVEGSVRESITALLGKLAKLEIT